MLVGLETNTANPNSNQLPRDMEATAHMSEQGRSMPSTGHLWA